jgi:hypothetical protein
MAGPRIVYSFGFIRELNLHRSKEQIEREFTQLEENTSEFAEFVHRLHKDACRLIAKYGGIKSVNAAEECYVVLRDRGLSFAEPLTVVYDENQKLMFVRYINLLCQRHFPQTEMAMLLTRAVCAKLPLSVERELGQLEQEQHISLPLHYDLEQKPLKKWLK